MILAMPMILTLTVNDIFAKAKMILHFSLTCLEKANIIHKVNIIAQAISLFRRKNIIEKPLQF